MIPLRPLAELSASAARRVRFVLCDVDDTLTHAGFLPSAALAALERLSAAGVRTIPVTGGAAGWCDMIARSWPVDAVIGESGAFYFHRHGGRMTRRFWMTEADRRTARARLLRLGREVVEAVPGCAFAGDQSYRECDLALDYAQDVPRLPDDAVARMVAHLSAAGATARVSSIHVNAWFGDYDKLSMALRLLKEVYGMSADEAAGAAAFIGDAPNDARMFAFFPLSVGVANIRRFAARLDPPPPWITEREGGYGFAEFADRLLALRMTDAEPVAISL